jgi:predicted MFS family arabinose efflux permease
VLVASIGVMVASSLVMASSPAFLVLVGGAALAGCAVAAGNPTTNKLIGVHIPAGERGVVTGVKQAGVQVGAFVVGIALPSTARVVGWRGALALVAAIAAAFVFLSLRVLPPDERSRRASTTRSTAALTPVVKWISVYGFLMGVGVSAVTAYVPLYARERVGTSVEEAGTIAAVIGLVGVLARVLWGWASERLGRFALPLALMALGAVVAMALVLLAPAAGSWVLWAGAVLLGVTAITWNAVGMLTIISQVRDAEAGRAAGWVLTGFYGGFVVSPVAFGYSVDVTGDYVVGWSVVALVFLAAAVLAVLSRRVGAVAGGREPGAAGRA